MDRPVEKTFEQTPEGGIFVEYHVGAQRSAEGGWNAN